MSKTRPAYAPHTLRTSTWGDADLTLKESDSGEVVLISTAFTGTNNRTATLPSAKKGLYFKFFWSVDDGTGNAYRAIKTAATSELIKGTVFVYDINTADQSNDIVANQLNGTNHDEIRVNDDIKKGSFVELVCDGDHWYTADSQIFTNETGADAVTES
jgi:hypothetical protein